MPAVTSIIAGASALPGLFAAGKDLFGGGNESGPGGGLQDLDPRASAFNKYLMDYIQGQISKPHQFRPVPEMPYNIMNMASNTYGMGPYQDPGWMSSAGVGPGAGMPGMPMPQISRGQLAAPNAMPQPSSRRAMS